MKTNNNDNKIHHEYLTDKDQYPAAFVIKYMDGEPNGGWGCGYVKFEVGEQPYNIMYNEGLMSQFLLHQTGLSISFESERANQESGVTEITIGFDTRNLLSNPVHHNEKWVKERTRLMYDVVSRITFEQVSELARERMDEKIHEAHIEYGNVLNIIDRAMIELEYIEKK